MAVVQSTSSSIFWITQSPTLARCAGSVDTPHRDMSEDPPSSSQPSTSASAVIPNKQSDEEREQEEAELLPIIVIDDNTPNSALSYAAFQRTLRLLEQRLAIEQKNRNEEKKKFQMAIAEWEKERQMMDEKNSVLEKEVGDLRSELTKTSVREAHLTVKVEHLIKDQAALTTEVNFQKKKHNDAISMQALLEEEKEKIKHSMNIMQSFLNLEKAERRREVAALKEKLDKKEDETKRERKRWNEALETMKKDVVSYYNEKAEDEKKTKEALQCALDQQKIENENAKTKACDEIARLQQEINQIRAAECSAELAMMKALLNEEKDKNKILEESSIVMGRALAAGIGAVRKNMPGLVKGLNDGLHQQLTATGPIASIMEGIVASSSSILNNDSPTGQIVERAASTNAFSSPNTGRPDTRKRPRTEERFE